jgi:hypothetical protein
MSIFLYLRILFLVVFSLQNPDWAVRCNNEGFECCVKVATTQLKLRAELEPLGGSHRMWENHPLLPTVYKSSDHLPLKCSR